MHDSALSASVRATAASDASATVWLHGPAGALLGTGVPEAVTGPAAALGPSLAPRLRELAEGVCLAGALPFNRDRPAQLWCLQPQRDPEQVNHWLAAQAASAPVPGPADWTLEAQPPRSAYEAAVDQALQHLREPGAELHKVVLARTLLATARQPVNPWWLAHQLGEDAHALRYVLPLPVDAGDPPAWLVGATPERLIARRGTRLLSEPLAGSAPRGPDAAASRARAEALQRSGKDLREHRYVVEAIADTLTPLCRTLQVPAAPSLYATATMWHLGTRIEGELRDASPEALAETSSLALATRLHPTPAVAGTPRTAALALIGTLEPVARDFYAGAVGWCDARGDGDWHVALRCARVQGACVRLYAGAGVVAASTPAAEGAETRAKFNTVLRALGLAARVPDTL